jgi:hypothetical protein
MARPGVPRLFVPAAVCSVFLAAPGPYLTPAASAVSPSARSNPVQAAPQPPMVAPTERIRLAFPGFQPGATQPTGLFPGRVVDQDFAAWPPMRYLGDSAFIAGKTFTVQDVLLIPSESYPIIYEPATGKRRPALEGLRTNLFDFSKNTGVFIPPNSTLVMVKVDVEPEAEEPPAGVAGCASPIERDYAHIIQVSYPGRGESGVLLTDRDENFGRFRSPRIYCMTIGWLYFYVDSVEIEAIDLWFEIIDHESSFVAAIWTLAPFPPK